MMRWLVEAVFGAASSEDNGVLWQRFREIRVVAAAFRPAVAACHHDKFPDSAGFYGFHDLVRQGKHLCVGKAAGDSTLLDLRGRQALFCLFDES